MKNVISEEVLSQIKAELDDRMDWDNWLNINAHKRGKVIKHLEKIIRRRCVVSETQTKDTSKKSEK